MTTGSEIDPAGESVAAAVPASTARTVRRRPRRRASGLLAGLAVVGLSAAIVAPTGMALAEPASDDAEVETSFSLALKDTQDLTVSVGGATVEAIDRQPFEVYVTPTPTPEPVVASSSSGGSSGGPAAVFYTGGGAPAEWMAAAGIASGDWGYVDYVVSRESGWNPNATNSGSGACGLVQALPCSKVPGNGYDPVDNLRWANGYATGRYGSWAGAYNFWINNHWW